MATIILESEETFEHTHRMTSTTTLVSGQVVLECDGVSTAMTPGVVVEVPAHSPHVLRNVGEADAVVQCARHIGSD